MPETITSHTPGPWVYSPDRHTHDSLIHQDKPVGQYGYYGPDSGGVVGSSEWTWLKDEDARLIAAAPDLLEALRPFSDFISVLEAMGGNTPRTGPYASVVTKGKEATITIEHLKSARAAIDKATGASDAQ